MAAQARSGARQVGVKGELGVGGTQGRDRYREVQSSSTAAPEAPSRGMRGQTGSDGTTKWALVSSKGPRQAHGRHAREMSTAQYGLCDQSQRSGRSLPINFLQYLLLSGRQVRPKKLLSVSAAADHVMQLLLVKSRCGPGRSVLESAASAIVQIVLSQRLLSSSVLAPLASHPKGPLRGREGR
jgi:hypothetical protein